MSNTSKTLLAKQQLNCEADDTIKTKLLNNLEDQSAIDTPIRFIIDKFRRLVNGQNPEFIEDPTREFSLKFQLNTIKDEDAEPFYLLSESRELIEGRTLIKTKQICSIADGMGGSGGTLRLFSKDNNDFDYKSEAYLASRAIQKAFIQTCLDDPELFKLDDLLIELNLVTIFQKVLKNLEEKYPTKKLNQKDLAKNSDNGFFTTFSAAIIEHSYFENQNDVPEGHQDKQYKKIKLIWSGDSPIVLLTPEKIISTIDCENSDAIGMQTYISSKFVDLDVTEISLDHQTPVVLINGSDGFFKFIIGALEKQSIFVARNIITLLSISENKAEFIKRLQRFYRSTPKYLDDTTMSILTSICNKDCLASLYPSDKTELEILNHNF